MPRPVPTAEFLEDWQDSLFESARVRLRKDGELTPLVWILTYAELVPEDFRKQCRPLDRGQSWADASDGFVVAVLPISHGPKHLRDMIYAIEDDEGRARLAMIETGATQVPGYTPDRLEKVLVRAWSEARGWDPKDIVSAFITEMLRRSGAVAYVKNMDAWTLHVTEEPGVSTAEVRAKYPKSLEHEERASEAIISLLEHAGGMRMVTQTYQRRRRNEGKVKSFGDREVTAIPRGSKELSGRFMWMLPVPEHAPAEGESH